MGSKRPKETGCALEGLAASWQPRSQAQADALACDADILLFGGAAGSLKSETLLWDARREFDNPALKGMLLRRTFPELEMSLIRRSRELYPGFGAVYNEQRKIWTFPAGGTIQFGYCESEKDIFRYQGAEFTFIGFDEATHFGEFPIRYLLSRMRSTSETIQLRMRLASNPGNIGHNTLKNIFQGPMCMHCHPGPPSREAGRVYSDAVWPSDQHPIGKTTCFIPGRLTDHELLGGTYAGSLASLPGAHRKALLEGCWDVYEGQYFDHWSPNRMVVKRQMIGEQFWWPHWVGVDYGFSGSQAVAYLCCRDPQGVTYVLDEYAAKHQTATDFARAMRERFVDGERRIVGWYLSPDAWNQRGDGHTIAAQMASAAGVDMVQARNDRIGGAHLVYTKLDRGELLIADTCVQLREAMPSRVHDPERPDDIRKISGDPLDDCIDALRYAIYSEAPAARPPAPEYAPAGPSPDPTIAMMQQRVAQQRMLDQQAPSYRRPALWRWTAPRRGRYF